MSDLKKFQGKTLDEAISAACEYYDCEREKLEIDIIEDAKLGLFGLFGAKEASITASKMSLPSKNHSLFYTKNKPSSLKKEEKTNKVGKNENFQDNTKTTKSNSHASFSATTPKETTSSKKQSSYKIKQEKNETSYNSSQSYQRPINNLNTRNQEKTSNNKVFENKNTYSEKIEYTNNTKQHIKKDPLIENKQEEIETESDTVIPKLPLQSLDQEKLIKETKDAVYQLSKGIVSDLEIDVTIQGERISVLSTTKNSGFLIGKDGYTLAAIEYLSTRIVTKKMNSHVRIQLEVGDYRTRQDNRLYEFAFILADRVRTYGKSTSTKPLTAYQRRIVHLALQNVPDIHTRSVGEGNLKRIIISLTKNGKTNTTN